MSSLPANTHAYLDFQLDWDNGEDRDLIEIAHHMLDWEVKMCKHLGLTIVDIHDIKKNHPMEAELRR